MAFISRDDFAVAAAYAAMSDWSDRVVDVNGPELLTIADYPAIASDVTGRKVTIATSTTRSSTPSSIPSAFRAPPRTFGQTPQRTSRSALMAW